MSKKMAKLAAAAVILIGVFVGFQLFNGTSSEIWAQVRDQVAAVNDHLKTAKRRAEIIRNAAQQNSRGNAYAGKSDDELQKKNLAVKQAILGLKPKYQAVITLRFFEKMKLIEIAEILGQNPATIRTQLARALSKLRKELRAAARLEP